MTFPISMRPTGWFQVGWSDEIAPGGVKGLRYFGQEVVAFRTVSGSLHVLDAHCAHLGAHLGFGGRVKEYRIVCPFHGWEWDGTGENVHIPYQERPNKARRIRSWPVAEANEAIFVWHDSAGRSPLFPVSDVFRDIFDDGAEAFDYYRAYPEAVIRLEGLPIHPQFTMENAVDTAHFPFVHHAHEMPRFTTQEVSDWEFRTTFEMTIGGGKETTVLTPDGPVEGGLNTLNCGIGIGFIRMFGPDTQRTMVCVTPVDDEVSDLFYTTWLPRLPGDRGEAVPDSLTRRLEFANNQFLADVAIWQHQCYTDPAGLATSEVRGFQAFRQWAQRFYPDAAEARTPQEDNKSLVRRFLDLSTALRLDEALDLLADDARIWVAGRFSPLCGWHTKESLRDMELRSARGYPDGMVMEFRSFTAEGDRVSVEAVSQAALRYGGTYNNEYHFMFRVRDGLIYELREYSDTHHAWECFVENRPTREPRRTPGT